MKARTVKPITCNALGFSIPAGTEFEIIAIVHGYGYATCDGLGVTSVWNDEFEII